MNAYGKMSCYVCSRPTDFYCCGIDSYCSGKCQKKDWRRHKLSCRRLPLAAKTIGKDEIPGECEVYFGERDLVPGTVRPDFVWREPTSRVDEATERIMAHHLQRDGPFYLPRLVPVFSFNEEFSSLAKFEWLLEDYGDFPDIGNIPNDIWQLPEGNVFVGKRIRSKTMTSVQLPYKQADLPDKMAILTMVLQTRQMREIAFRNKRAIWEYEEDEFDYTLCRLLLLNDQERYRDYLGRNSRDYSYILHLQSCQDYLSETLVSLYTPEVEMSGQILKKDLEIALPDFDDPSWPFTVQAYGKIQGDAYYVKQLSHPKHVNIIVRTSQTKRLVGYVTCTLHELGWDKTDETPFFDANLEQFRQYGEFRTPLNLFSIDGLHISEEARGGREKSIATLLVFHALHFIRTFQQTIKQPILLATYAVAWPTLLILERYGFSEIDPDRVVKWLQKHATSPDIRNHIRKYIYNHSVLDPRLNEVDIGEKRDVNAIVSDLIALGPLFNSIYESDYQRTRKLFGESWNMFMCLGTLDNANLAFDDEMFRITSLIRGTVKKRPTKSELEEETGQKRTKFSLYFPDTILSQI